MFFAALTRASRFFPLQLPFFRFNYHRQSIEVVVRQVFHQMISNHLIQHRNFHSFVYLSLSTFYAIYISIFIFFFMFQRTG
jgi:hypothetical protein